MAVALITGSAGLIGSETARRFTDEGLQVVGIDNDMRRSFFGDRATTAAIRDELCAALPGYVHFDVDVRDQRALEHIFSTYGTNLAAVVHAAAQPSHDWAAREPLTDFAVNANGTLNLLELTRRLPRLG